MNDLRTSGSICAETEPSLLTRIRGIVRQLPEGVAKERASLLAAQLENGVPAAAIARQVEIMAG